jgi:hypothetical protein
MPKIDSRRASNREAFPQQAFPLGECFTPVQGKYGLAVINVS